MVFLWLKINEEIKYVPIQTKNGIKICSKIFNQDCHGYSLQKSVEFPWCDEVQVPCSQWSAYILDHQHILQWFYHLFLPVSIAQICYWKWGEKKFRVKNQIDTIWYLINHWHESNGSGSQETTRKDGLLSISVNKFNLIHSLKITTYIFNRFHTTSHVFRIELNRVSMVNNSRRVIIIWVYNTVL